jgi:hypothetical protein
MPITIHDQPTYALDCDRDQTPAEHDDGTPHLFDTEDAARKWARDNGWQVTTTTGEQLLCTECAIDAANEREHAEEIAAAVEYSLGVDSGWRL